MPDSDLGSKSAIEAQADGAISGSAMLPFISVVIPVRNEEAHLGALLEDLVGQDYPKGCFEILIADGESTDGTAKVVRRYAGSAWPRVELLSNPARLSSAGRNIGIRYSRGEAIVFIDGHCRVPNRSFLSETARIMRETGADCLCRPQPLTMPDNSRFQNVVAHARATLIGHGRDSTIYATDTEGFVDPTSSGAVYRRSVFERIGFYDERFDACEDVEFNYRVHCAGLRSYFSGRLEVWYRPRARLSGLFRQAVRYGRGRFRLMKKHPSAASLPQLIPALFVAGLAGETLGFWVSSAVRGALWLALAAYTGLVGTFSAMLGVRHGWRHAVAAPAVYLTLHLGFGTGFWLEAGLTLYEGLRRATGNCSRSAFPVAEALEKNGNAPVARRKRMRVW